MLMNLGLDNNIQLSIVIIKSQHSGSGKDILPEISHNKPFQYFNGHKKIPTGIQGKRI
jgi:hypothetical protein